jgi:hypothetical protein
VVAWSDEKTLLPAVGAVRVVRFEALMSSEVRVRDAVDRVMRAWSLIKLVPEQSGSGTRSSVTKLLLEHPHLTEDELVVIGLKHLYQTDAPKKHQERDVGVEDRSLRKPVGD